MLKIVRQFLGLIAFGVAWELLSVSGIVRQDFVPSLATIGGALLDFMRSPSFWEAFSITVQRMLLGLLIAVAISLVLAIIAGRYPLIKRALDPITDVLRSLPPPALVPLLVFVLGIGAPLFYFVVIFGCMWSTYISAANALSVSEPVQINTARTFDMTDWQIMWQIRLPAAMPEIFTGIRLSASISLLATVATEMLVGGSGLGSKIFDAGFSLLWDDMYALMFVIGVLGILMNALVTVIRRPIAGWQTRYAAMGAGA